MGFQRLRRGLAGALALASFGAGVIGCSPGRPSGAQVVESEFTGVVNFGTPLVGADIELYEVVEGRRGVSLGTATTNESGEFSVSTFFYEGLVEVCAQGGEFEDLRTGLSVSLDERICAVVENASDGGLRVHAWNVIVSAALPANSAEPGALLAAQREWRGRLSCATDGLDVIGVTPEDPRVAGEGSALSSALYSGLLHAALSELAAEISVELGFTAGARFTPLTLLRGAVLDLNDGEMDGFDGSALVTLEGYTFTSETFASRLALALRSFLGTELNSGGFDEGDLGDAIVCIGGELDISAPAVTWLTPAEGAIASGPLPVSAVIVDDSEIVSLTFDDPNAYSDINAIAVETSTNLSAIFDPESLPNGEYALTLRAVDSEGNSAVATRSVVIDKDAPRISVAQPVANATLSGNVTIQATAEDPQGLVRFELLAPEGISASVLNGVLTAVWDTTELPDGPVSLLFAAEDGLGNVGELSVPVVLDNLAPSVINGAVRLETDVARATVEAFDFNGFERGAVLSTTETADDGTFTIEIPDSHSGLLVLDASGSEATYESLIDGATVRFNLDDRLSTVVQHQPTVAGTVIEPIYVNGLTSIGTRFAEAHAGGAADPLRGFALLGEYLRPEDPIDIRRTLGSDMTQNVTADTNEAQFVGLWHIGLSRLGGDIAATVNAPVSAGRTTNMLEPLLADVASGQFDGRNVGGSAVRLLTTAEPFDTNTLRFAIANAIIRFLEAEPIGTLPQSNDTGLLLANFFGPGGYLFALAENESELFGDDPPPISLDIEAPVVAVQLLDNAGLPVTQIDPLPVDVVETVRIRAQDASGVPSAPSFQLVPGPESALGIPHPVMVGATTTTLDIPITTASLNDGAQTFTAEATDALGETTTAELAFVVDNSAPTLTLSAPGSVTTPDITASVTLADASPVTLTYELNGAVVATRENFTGASDSLSVSIPCNQASALRVTALDAAGNSSQRQVTTICDNTPPTITFNPSLYRNETAVEASLSGISVTLGSAVDLAAGGIPTIEKVEGRYGEGVNLPFLEYSVTDPGPVGTRPQDIALNFRFSGCSNVGNRSVSPTSSGDYNLELTPEVLASCLRTVSPGQNQTVTFTATDALGNSSEASFTFRLQLRPVPVVVDQCAVNSTLNTLGYDSLQGVFDGDSGNAWSAAVAWPYPPGAAYDFPAVELGVSGGAATYEMTRWDEIVEFTRQVTLVSSIQRTIPSYRREYCGPGEGWINANGGVSARTNQPFSQAYDLYQGVSLRLGGSAVGSGVLTRNTAYTVTVDALFPSLFTTTFGGSTKYDAQWVLRGSGEITEWTRQSSLGGGSYSTDREEYTCGATLDRSILAVSPPTLTASRGGDSYPITFLNSCGGALPSLDRSINR